MVLILRDQDDGGFKTLFDLFFRDTSGTPFHIGEVKIGEFGAPANAYPIFPEPGEFDQEFTQLPDQYFSLGQDDSYYVQLKRLGADVMDEVLRSLNDVALDLDLFTRALPESVTRESLLRDVTQTTVRNQFHRLARGGERLTEYSFIYRYTSGPELSFDVVPESKPPSNVHVLIGSNGVGKSRLLNQLAARILHPDDRSVEGSIEYDAEEEFANLVSVAFSAFDNFEQLLRTDGAVMDYASIGLKKPGQAGLKNDGDLADEFAESVMACLRGARRRRWERALATLEGDPIFADERVALLAGETTDPQSAARDLFRYQLSSGHKAVLLTITRLVESVQEQTLVLIDEPETHLHPPLLSAFMRALSDLLIDRNGVAIVATHSPVVLQEVPKDCVWVLRRSGRTVEADRPEIETFGENVGTLTHEVFGLEVTKSGFHKMLDDAVNDDDNRGRTYAQLVWEFGGKLGSEAKALLQTLITIRSRRS